MGLTRPGDESTILASATEFMNLVERHGLNRTQICQVTIAIAAAAILDEADGDDEYAKQLIGRYLDSLRTAVLNTG